MIKEFVLDGIVLYEAKHFDAKDILTCGQVFRYFDNGSHYSVISLDKKCDIVKEGDKIRLVTDDGEYFNRYFDLDVSYGAVIERLKGLPFMEEATENGKGIRILKQDPFETVVSFIISANNHIPRIKGIIERLCVSLGEKKDGYYAFPTAERLAGVDAKFYSDLGAGYRAEYLARTAADIAGGFPLDKINELDSESANKKLCTLMGVGPKVADCILLFGYARQDVFPVDTWIKKVYADIFSEGARSPKEIRRALIATYGELSGYAQQYLFYNKRG
ncbi:MAG: DNA-3-methyladenine glycosylase 2 family protein [Clostridia bacterium]|jgi:N-glycosylase/DNA lyase|nr:DNA-3-methyladenine glycosylase 2 family protein [Clostridia bacterium]MCX4367406.1 hypothetical protein [Clostridia bacterium]